MQSKTYKTEPAGEVKHILLYSQKFEDEKDDAVERLKQVTKSLEKEKEMVASLQAKISEMQIEMEESEEKHKHNYYHMYQKVKNTFSFTEEK